MYTIKDITEGKCAVINDGTFEELESVLRKAFPDSHYKILGKMKFYKTNSTNDGWIGMYNMYSLPTQSVKDFLLPQFKQGERVMVKNYEDGIWIEKIYLTTIDKLFNKYICISTGYEKEYEDGNYVNVAGWRYIQKLEEEKIVELTLKEVSEKLGVPINLLRIKD